MKKYVLNLALILGFLATGPRGLANAPAGLLNFYVPVVLLDNNVNLTLATGTEAWLTGGVITLTTGEWSAHISSSDIISLHPNWTFGTGPIDNFWTGGGFTFDLTSSTAPVHEFDGSISTEAYGYITGNGFAGLTAFSFRFENQQYGFPTATVREFDYLTTDDGGNQVPDSGPTAALLVFALGGIGLLRQKCAG